MTQDSGMRIALMTSPGEFRGFGIAEFSKGMATGLVNTRKSAAVLACRLRGSALEAAPGLDIEIAPSWAHNRIGQLIWENAYLPRRFGSWNAELVHAPAYVSPVKLNLPFVLTVHDLFSTFAPELCRIRNVIHHRALLYRSMKRAERILTPSLNVRAQVIHHLGCAPEKVVSISPGIDRALCEPCTDDQVQKLRAQYGLPRNYLLWLGNLEPKKNLALLLHAVRATRHDPKQLPLVMAGGSGWGPIRPKHLQEAGIQWLGYIPAEHRASLYQGASALLFPSKEEGFGLPVLEAMACGTPVIASPVPAAIELGLSPFATIHPGQLDSLVSAMRKLSRSIEDARMSALRQRAKASTFTWEQHAHHLWRTYGEVLR